MRVLYTRTLYINMSDKFDRDEKTQSEFFIQNEKLNTEWMNKRVPYKYKLYQGENEKIWDECQRDCTPNTRKTE